MEKKFELSEKVRKELEQNTEEAKKTLEGKEKEIQDMKDGLHQGKEVAVYEYRDSDALLSELEDSFLQWFDNTLCQVKKAYPDLDVSNINVEDQAQTSVMPVTSDDTDDLFAKVDDLGDGESAQLGSSLSQSINPSRGSHSVHCKGSHSTRRRDKAAGKYFSSKIVFFF